MLQRAVWCLELRGHSGHELLALPDGELQPRTLVVRRVGGLRGQVAQVAEGRGIFAMDSCNIGANPKTLWGTVPLRNPNLPLQAPCGEVDSGVDAEGLLEAHVLTIGCAGGAEEPVCVWEQLALADQQGLRAGLAAHDRAHGFVDRVAVAGLAQRDRLARAFGAPSSSNDRLADGRREALRCLETTLLAPQQEDQLGVDVDGEFDLMGLYTKIIIFDIPDWGRLTNYAYLN